MKKKKKRRNLLAKICAKSSEQRAVTAGHVQGCDSSSGANVVVGEMSRQYGGAVSGFKRQKWVLRRKKGIALLGRWLQLPTQLATATKKGDRDLVSISTYMQYEPPSP